MVLKLRDLAQQIGVEVAQAESAAGGRVEAALAAATTAGPASSEVLAPETLVVVEWAPSRRDGALPPLAPLVEELLRRRAGAVLVVVRGRNVHPPAEVIEQLRAAGVPLLWTANSSGSAEQLVAAAQSAIDGTPGARWPSKAMSAVETVLDGELTAVALVERLSETLGAALRIDDTYERTVVDHVAPGYVHSATEAQDWPLTRGSERVGTLWIRRSERLAAPQRRLLAFVGPVLALAVRADASSELVAAPSQSLLSTILGEDLAARERAIRRSRRQVAFPARDAALFVVIAIHDELDGQDLLRLTHTVESSMRAEDERATVISHEGCVVAFVDERVNRQRLLETMSRRALMPLSVGESRRVHTLRGLPTAFRQAQRAAFVGRGLRASERVTHYDRLRGYRLLYLLPEHERRAFVRDYLGPVASSDPSSVEARRMLQAYLASNGNMAEAARSLFMHYNTFRQRLGRLQEQLGEFVTDASLRTAIVLALDLLDLEGAG